MAIKKKVTYSVSYVAGTDTLTTKLNSLLQDVVTLILSQNSGLSVIDTITVGSDRFSGAPLYDTYNSKLYSTDYNNRHYESDVVFLGTNASNVCLSLGFFDGCLVVSMNMTPAVEAEYVADWTDVYGINATTYLPFYAVGKQSRWFKNSNSNAGRYCLPYRIINNAISLSVIYWTGDYSRGYSFVNGAGESDGVDLVIFNTDEGGNASGLGAAIWTWGRINNSGGTYYNSLRRAQVTAFSFAENLSSNKPSALPTGNSNVDPGETQQQLINSRYDIRIWGAVNNSAAAGASYFANFQSWHSLCGTDGNVQNYAYMLNSPDLWYSISNASDGNVASNALTPAGNRGFSPLCLGYNLPHLSPGQAYVRKMRVPGWNPECKGEVYLLWSPVLTAYQSGDIVEVGSKSYAIITEGAVAWAARVA